MTLVVLHSLTYLSVASSFFLSLLVISFARMDIGQLVLFSLIFVRKEISQCLFHAQQIVEKRPWAVKKIFIFSPDNSTIALVHIMQSS